MSTVLAGANTGAQSFDGSDIHLLTVFAGIAAISLLVLVVIAVGILGALVIVGVKAKVAAVKIAQEVKGKIYPIIDKTTGLVTTLSPTIQSITEKTDALIGELSPKISGITGNVQGIVGNVEHMSSLARKKIEEFSPTLSAINHTVGSTNETVQDVNRKTHQQVERVDSMLTSILDKASELPGALSRAVQVPRKIVTNWSKAARVRVDSLLSKLRATSKAT